MRMAWSGVVQEGWEEAVDSSYIFMVELTGLADLLWGITYKRKREINCFGLKSFLLPL